MGKPFSAAVFVIAPEGVILVRDLKRPQPEYWKFPGGHGWPSETPYEAAARELEEETGIVLHPFELDFLFKEERENGNESGKHDFFLFSAIIPKLPELLTRGNDGEEIKVVPLSFLGDPLFSPHHRRVIMSFLESPRSD